jgi:hypothetical protein
MEHIASGYAGKQSVDNMRMCMSDRNPKQSAGIEEVQRQKVPNTAGIDWV